MTAVERSALGREGERKKTRDTFYPCCPLLSPNSVICSLEHQGSSQASHLSPSEPVLQSILEAGKKSVVLPGKELLSGVEQPSVATPIHPSSCLGRAICCPLLLLFLHTKKWKFASSCVCTGCSAKGWQSNGYQLGRSSWEGAHLPCLGKSECDFGTPVSF